MSDRALLEDLIAKLREMEEQLSMAELETESQAILRGRIRHLYILATYVRMKLQGMAETASLLPRAGPDQTIPDSEKRG